ncbi:alkaline phosphatase family protein [Salinirubellus salinus]|uniref:Alkaline phosphatase family protein n=1 Tax=Salinirubellus salinus TaxID=1364945 RepID=A0A9E7UAZ9_9EURY|nr:alkaline phosphatase family protein [Salinirubellus salinus]UWM54319.1 alkaline phosphatase family protein [Salinirubellus salinus]
MTSDDASAGGLRTLLVGLDGTSPDLLESLFDAGVAPTIRDVFEGGVGGVLESQLPPWTASAWPSIYTGVNPGKHGVFDFLMFDGYDWDVVNRSHVREYALWELLSERGLSSVVVNVPVTHPPRPFDGALVPGYVAPDRPTCHPLGLLEDIEAELGAYRVYGSTPADPSDRERISEYRELIRMRGEAFRYLVDRFDPSFGFVQFQQTDTVFHEIPENETAIRAVYEAVDDELERVLEQCRPKNVVLVSDHGIGPIDGYGFRVNEYLRNHGYVETTPHGGGTPSWTAAIRSENGSEETSERRSAAWLEKVVALAARGGLTSQRLERLLAHVGLDEFVVSHVPTSVIRTGTEQVDFTASAAYMRSRLELGVRLNLAGREPDGVVPRDQYETVRSDLIELLSAARTPDGDPVFEAVLPNEAVFEGPYRHHGPDIVTVPDGFDHLPAASLLGSEFGPPAEPWEHKRFGIVAAAGAAVDETASLDGAHIFDVAPTVLATLGLPATERMDGRALPVVDPVGTAPYGQFEAGAAEASTGTDAVARRLTDLGYLE